MMMRRTKSEQSWVAIDIGTTKICVLVAALDTKGSLEILGIGTHPSHGLKKGVVVDVDSTVESIKHAIAEAENMSGQKITSVAVGISGGHIQSFNSQGVVAVKRRDIQQDDIDRVIDAARAIPIPDNREILHVLPQYFKIDGQEVVDNSLGMSGVRLEAQVHIITGNISSASNIITCCELAGVSVSDIVLEQLASAEAVLSESERMLGIGILDIGGGTSDFAIYKDGKIRYSKVLPIAGNHFTNDTAICLRIPISKAEELKCSEGGVRSALETDQSDRIIATPLGYDKKLRHVPKKELYEILRPRAQEVFDLLLDEALTFKLMSFMQYGLVLTGGGSLLDGMVDLAEETFGIPVRIGVPCSREDGVKSIVPDGLKSPIYATAYGLIIHAVRRDKERLTSPVDGPLFSRVFKRMKSWIYDFI
jgi:cell division protein FtsA